MGENALEQPHLRIPHGFNEEQYRQHLQQTLIDMIPNNLEMYRGRRKVESQLQGQPPPSKSRNSSNSRRGERSSERISAADAQSLLWQQKISSNSSHSNLAKLNQKQQLALGFNVGRNENSRSRSSDAPDLTEVDNSEAEDGDEHRRKARSTSSRSRTPDIPSAELNGSPGPFSQQQILQAAAAGLPYFHLLPPALRNDAARYLFIPPVLPGADLSTAVAASTPNSVPPSVTPVSMKSEKSATGENSRSAPAYLCEPCNIKFSSARTLEAHQTYYCSFRKDIGKDGEKNDDGDSKGEGTTTSQSSTGGGKKRERESSGEERDLGDESGEISGAARGPGSISDSVGNSANKNMKTGKLYSCIYCSYSADKKVSLNRHMRMHSGPPISSIQLPSNSNDEQGPSAAGNNSTGSNIGANKNLPEGVNALERYCQDCDIQFSSIKTYRVHKQYYCSTRHVLKAQQGGGGPGASPAIVPSPQLGKQQGVEIGGGITVTPIRKTSGSPLPPEGSPISTPGPMPPQPFVILPTNPVIIVPYCFIQGASILPGNVLPSQNALVVLPNGSVHGLPATVMPMPMPMPSPSPSPSQSLGGGISSHFMHNSFSASGNNNSGSNSNAHGSNSLSPNSQSQSVFNDPKDIIRKICSIPRNQSNSAESTQSESSIGNNQHNHHRRSSTGGGAKTPVGQPTSANFSKENDEANDTDADLDGEQDTEAYGDSGACDESMPAIDLTLRNIQPKKERISADEEKENREVALNRAGIGSHGLMLGGGSGNGTHPSSMAHLDFHRDRELSSPSERLSVGSGSGSGGKRTPRPPSTSISSSCSTPPALCEPKINGILSRGSPSGRDRDESPSHGGINPQVNNKNSMMMMMMNANVNSNASSGGNSKKGSGVDYSVLEMSKLRGGSGSMSSGGKMSPIATQLPGGAILTSATSQSLAELLMSNPPELNESLAKLNPQVLLNSRSAASSPLGLNLNFNPAMLSALTPELAMRFLEPTYLVSLQHSLQQQQQNLAQQQQTSNPQAQQVPPPKRGVSKCIECDIVFYKYENFLVHKEHYCAARTANQQPITNSIATNLKSPSRESVHGGKESQSQSRISSCSSPARSEAEIEESLSPLSCPTPVALQPNKNKSSASNASSRSQPISNLLRKSPDSSMEIAIPVDSHSANLSKSKSKSPVAITTPLSISPISSPKEGKEITNCKEKTTGAQYPCLQCGVKYSTLDNLQTHQAFYCTKRIGANSCENNNNSCNASPVESKTSNEVKNNTNNNNKGFLKCGKCKLTIPEDQMGSHSRVCNDSNGSSCATSLSSSNSTSASGMAWKCPCCDTYSPTVSAAQKHLESHTGIRAFKCLLCGYRGNTLRGMRTHIRMHFDKRVSDIQEGEYITCITANDPEPSVSGRGGGNTAQPSVISQIPPAQPLTIPSPDQNHRNLSPNRVEMEKERERANHSPRSAKGSQPSSSTPMSPAEGNFTSDKLENSNRLHFCHLCNYSSSYKGNVVRHMKLVHKISEEFADELVSANAALHANSSTTSTVAVRSPPEEVNGADSRDSNSKCSTDFVSSVNISVSSAKAAAAAAISPQQLQNHNESSSESEFPISLNSNPPRPPSTTITNNLTNKNAKANNNNQKTTNSKTITRSSGAGANLTVNGIGATGSGGESHSGSENENNETRKCSSRSESDEDLTLTAIQKKEKPCAVKYCKSCNIPFNYLSTFNAHKKFYCPGINLVSSTDAEAPERAETPVQ